MSGASEVEAAFVKSFIALGRQERWREFLPSPKQRGKILQRLAYDHGDFDERFLYRREALPPDIARKVDDFWKEWKKANPQEFCYTIGRNFDGEPRPFAEVDGSEELSFGGIIIVEPRRLAYWNTDRQPNKVKSFVLYRDDGR